MRKMRNRLKETLYGMFPLLILFGIPAIIAIVILAICNWDNIPMILSRLSVIGNGSTIAGTILILFALIGLANAFAAFMLWINKFAEYLKKKSKSSFGIWFAIIVVTLGWAALFEIIKKL